VFGTRLWRRHGGGGKVPPEVGGGAARQGGPVVVQPREWGSLKLPPGRHSRLRVVGTEGFRLRRVPQVGSPGRAAVLALDPLIPWLADF